MLVQVGSIFRIYFCIALVFALLGCTSDYARQVISQTKQDIGWGNLISVNRNVEWIIPFQSSLALGHMPLKLNSDVAFEAHHSSSNDVDRIEAKANLYPRLAFVLHETSFDQLLNHYAKIEVASARTVSQMLAISRYKGVNLLVVPSLTRAKDNQNNHTERMEGPLQPNTRPGRDLVVLRFTVYDVVSRNVIDVSTVRIESGKKSRRDTLETLIDQGVRAYIATVAGRPDSVAKGY